MKSRAKLVLDSMGAIACGTVATHEPSPRSRPSRVSIDYRGTLRPTIVCRQHKTPHPRGHRTYLEVKR